MAGRWQLSLGAKVQGETGTVENKLVIHGADNEAAPRWNVPPPRRSRWRSLACSSPSHIAGRAGAEARTRHGAGARRDPRRRDLLSGSGRQAVLLADAEEDADGRDYRAVPAGADVSFDDDTARKCRRRRGGAAGERKIKYYRNPMGLPDTSPTPKKDSMGMDYIPVYEGDDTDDGSVKVSPGKIQRTGVKSEPAALASIRTTGAGARHDSARRASCLGHRDARGNLPAIGRRRHDWHHRQEGPAPDAGLQSGGFQCGRRVRDDIDVQDYGGRAFLRARLAATVDEPRRTRRGDRGRSNGRGSFP